MVSWLKKRKIDIQLESFRDMKKLDTYRTKKKQFEITEQSGSFMTDY